MIKQIIYSLCVACPLCSFCYLKGYAKGQEVEKRPNLMEAYNQDVLDYDTIIVQPHLDPNDPNPMFGWDEAVQTPHIFSPWHDCAL